MENARVREIIKEMVTARSQRIKKNGVNLNIDPSNFDWYGYLVHVDTQMKALNNKFVLTSLDKLKNEDKLTPIINKFIKIRDESLNYFRIFNSYYSKLSDIDKSNYQEIISIINDFTIKKTKLEKTLFKMHDLFEEMGDIDNVHIF